MKDDSNKVLAYANWRKVTDRTLSPEMNSIFDCLKMAVSFALAQDMTHIARRANYIADVVVKAKKLHKSELRSADVDISPLGDEVQKTVTKVTEG